jgi:hypothetical protein
MVLLLIRLVRAWRLVAQELGIWRCSVGWQQQEGNGFNSLQPSGNQRLVVVTNAQGGGAFLWSAAHVPVPSVHDNACTGLLCYLPEPTAMHG